MSKRERKPLDYDRVRDAWDALAKLERPKGLESVAWASVWMVLHRLARYAKYDVIRPTQQRLAEELHMTRRAVQTRLDLAERFGFIKRTYALESGRWAFTVYELLFLHAPSLCTDRAPSASTDHAPSQGTNTLPKKEVEEQTGDFVSNQQRVSAAGRNAENQETSVTPGGRDADEIALAYGERTNTRITRKAKKVPGGDLSRRMANYFAEKWEAVVYERPEFRDLRCMDGIQQATGYFRSVFFKPAAGRVYTEGEVVTMIDDFMGLVQTSRIRIKPNQSVLMRFTGKWGRGQKAVAPTTNADYGFRSSRS